MSRHSKAGQLLRALQLMLPEATLRIVQETPWHSLTFAGTQICICAGLQDARGENAQQFAKDLPDHEFELSSQLVADIAVTEARFDTGQHSLVIDALILDS